MEGGSAMTKSLDQMLKEAEDEQETASILADEADRVRELAITRLNQCRRVVQMIREAILAKEAGHDPE